MVIELPWPPSVNHYWRRCGNRYFVSAEGKSFRDQVYLLASEFRGHFKENEHLEILIEAYPPDRRRRDLDNILKSLLDSLQYAEVYEDDSQIDFLAIRRNDSLEKKLIVEINALKRD